jgi:conjugal transfer pilus assembly protein TraW
MPFTQRLVVFDATNPDQVEFVKSLPKSSKRTKYITTRYDRSLKWDAVKHIEEQLGAPVYQLKPDIIQAFSLQVVPSVIVADNVRKVFVIEETQVGYFGEGQ